MIDPRQLYGAKCTDCYLSWEIVSYGGTDEGAPRNPAMEPGHMTCTGCGKYVDFVWRLDVTP